MPDTHPHITFMEDWFREVWTEENAGAIDARFVEGGQAKGLGSRPVVGPAEFRQFHAALLGLVSDVRIAIDDHLCDGDTCSLVCTVTGNCRRTGNPVEFTGSCFLKFAGGKIAHCENHFEFMALYEQLGLLPEGAFARALGGEKLAG